MLRGVDGGSIDIWTDVLVLRGVCRLGGYELAVRKRHAAEVKGFKEKRVL